MALQGLFCSLYAKVLVPVKILKVFGQAFFKRLAGVRGQRPRKRVRRSARGELKNSPVDCFLKRTAVASDRGKNYFAPKLKRNNSSGVPVGNAAPARESLSFEKTQLFFRVLSENAEPSDKP